MAFTLLPKQFAQVPHLNWVRGALGAFFGIAATGFVCRLWLGASVGDLPLLIAPLGASAVLAFALPASPLAQPWSVVGGNFVSALVGVAAAQFVPDPHLAAGLAVGGAITAMALARCLHPPGGAVALTAVIGPAAIHAAGWHYALVPVALNSTILVALAWLFNNASGHSYPHRATPAPAQPRLQVQAEDIAAALADYDELIDVSGEDLLALFQAAEAKAEARRG